MKIFRFCAIFFILSAGCNPDKVDTKGVKQEMEKYKIKRINQGEILSKGMELGTEIASKVQQSLNQKRDSVFQAEGLEKALPYCVISNEPLLRVLEKEYHAKIFRAGFPDRLRNPSSGPDSIQSQILEGYVYGMEKGLPPVKDAMIREEHIIFNAPVMLDSKSCLPCHGKPGTEVSEQAVALIKSKYPQDRSLNFRLNDPIGVWTIIIEKEEVVRRIR